MSDAETGDIQVGDEFDRAGKRVPQSLSGVLSGMTGYPDNNPKTAFGARKPSFHFVPPVAELHLGQAMADGGSKYGTMNWREKTISSSVYYDAARRHLAAWWDGEDIAPDSGVHHLGHLMACCALILDGEAQGKLNDDRPIPGKFAEVAARMTKGTDQAAQAAVEGRRTGLVCAGKIADAGSTSEEPRFKVGDRIKCACDTCSRPDRMPVRGTVKSMRKNGYLLDSGYAISFANTRPAP